MKFDDSIVALSSAYGISAVAVIRCSGTKTFSIIEKIFYQNENTVFNTANATYRKMYFGYIHENNKIVDELMICLFKAPHSYTAEDLVEIYCHGSTYVQQKILQLFLINGARYAEAGEFTIRAYLNGKITLAKAEAIGDIIHSESESAHQLAINQMRGGYIELINQLRNQLLQFASLVELELDFSEEDVEFANRHQLKSLTTDIISKINELTESFEMGNSIKNGIPVCIVGKPNAGKSTLLNALLKEEKAIVSEIPGTTRDLIEDRLTVQGMLFRIIDTAGIREAQDAIENIGIEKAFGAIRKSSIIVYLTDVNTFSENEINIDVQKIKNINPKAELIVAINKIDDCNSTLKTNIDTTFYLKLSGKNNINIDVLKQKWVDIITEKGYNPHRTMVSNARHFNELTCAKTYLEKVLVNIDNHHTTTDLLAEDIKAAIQHLANITGGITNEDVLKNIFSQFCIGK